MTIMKLCMNLIGKSRNKAKSEVMDLFKVTDYEDVPDHHQIRTDDGRIFLNSLIQNHPLAVIDILAEGGYDALIKLVLAAEDRYHDIIKKNPNDIDGAIDAMYGTFMNDSELDQEIEDLENKIYLKEQEQYQNDEFEDFFSDQELAILPENTLLDLYDLRTQAKRNKIENEKMKLQSVLDKKIKFRESMTPLLIPNLTSDLYSF